MCNDFNFVQKAYFSRVIFFLRCGEKPATVVPLPPSFRIRHAPVVSPRASRVLSRHVGGAPRLAPSCEDRPERVRVIDPGGMSRKQWLLLV